MSESEEEESFCFYGKPLEPFDEDAFPKKKPISVEDQIATDSHGRRRFHGAFTGGFSAGFFNSVGSLEGWTPSNFKSSRQEKAESKKQRPQDFMDDEDIGEFGFAPETVKATKDFSTVSKRKREVQSISEGPIPGEPVLETLISSGDETVGYLLLKNIGLEDKKKIKEAISTGEKTYGCQMPSSSEVDTITSVLQEDSYKIPDIYKTYLNKPKNDTFGMGYSGLDKSHLNLFKSTNFVVHDKNKKLSIAGQAFGVGAFEEEDDDIYAKEDMARYDFEITKEKEKAKKQISEAKVLDMFVLSKQPAQNTVRFPLPSIPHSFTGKHKVKKSRFEPVPEEKVQPVSRSSINPQIRAKYLGEETNENPTSSKEASRLNTSTDQHRSDKVQNSAKDNEKEESTNSNIKKQPSFNADLIFDKFVSASQTDDHTNLLEPVKATGTNHGTQEMRDAARMKMFGPLTRVSLDWQPCALLCKRFNVPEPNFDGTSNTRNRKRTKHLIFQYQSQAEAEPDLKPGLSIQKQEEATEIADTKANLNERTLNPENNSNVPDVSIIKVETPETSQIQEASISDTIVGSQPVPSSSTTEDKPTQLTDKIGIEKNIDLFKAVFLSSSESEGEEPQEEPVSKIITEEMKKNILSDEFIPKIKPMKEGILSNIGHIKFTKPQAPTSTNATSSSSSTQNNDDTKQSPLVNSIEVLSRDESLYGPKIPENVAIVKTSTTYVPSSSSEDEWIEKSSEKKKKHKKKHKKEKKSHKKNKKNKR